MVDPSVDDPWYVFRSMLISRKCTHYTFSRASCVYVVFCGAGKEAKPHNAEPGFGTCITRMVPMAINYNQQHHPDNPVTHYNLQYNRNNSNKLKQTQPMKRKKQDINPPKNTLFCMHKPETNLQGKPKHALKKRVRNPKTKHTYYPTFSCIPAVVNVDSNISVWGAPG